MSPQRGAWWALGVAGLVGGLWCLSTLDFTAGLLLTLAGAVCLPEDLEATDE